MSQIVFLDAGTVDYGDISLEELKRLGNYGAYPWTPHDQIEKRAAGAQIIVTNKCRFDHSLLGRLPALKLIALAATGTNNIDLKAARRQKVAVANVSGYSTDCVVQFTIAFVLALSGSLIPFNEAARDGRWSRSPLFTYSAFPIREVFGKTLGVVGYGAIGKRVIKIAKALGMKTLIARIPGRSYAQKKIRRVSLDFLARHSDFISLHAPLTPLTENLINRSFLKKMNPDAYLINMARGGLVDETALARALKGGKLAGAASDVLREEPPPKDHPLLKEPHFLLTPHVAWASREARIRLVHEMALNIQAFQQGRRRNRVA